MVTSAVIILLAVHTLMLLVIMYFVAKKKVIKLERSSEGVIQKAIMTPSGTLMVEKKRSPVVNDDESIVKREESI